MDRIQFFITMDRSHLDLQIKTLFDFNSDQDRSIMSEKNSTSFADINFKNEDSNQIYILSKSTLETNLLSLFDAST